LCRENKSELGIDKAHVLQPWALLT
jgi:hypothetical protein